MTITIAEKMVFNKILTINLSLQHNFFLSKLQQLITDKKKWIKDMNKNIKEIIQHNILTSKDNNQNDCQIDEEKLEVS